jgi:hypothetical protein
MYLLLNPTGKSGTDAMNHWGLPCTEVREPGFGVANGHPTRLSPSCSSWPVLLNLAGALAFEQGGLRGVISCHESTLLVAAYLRAQLQVPGPSFDQVLPFVHKLAMKSTLRAAGLPVADHALATRQTLLDATADVVLKPVLGASCIGTERLDPDQAALVSRMDQCDVRLIEAALDLACEYHVDLVVEGCVARLVSVSRYLCPPLSARIRPLVGSGMLASTDPLAGSLGDMALQAVRALGRLNGVYHCEILETLAGERFIGEVAARPGGGPIRTAVMLSHGVDLMKEHLRLGLDDGDRAGVAAEPFPEQGRRVAWGIFRAPPGEIDHIHGLESVEASPGVLAVEQHLFPGDSIPIEAHPYTGVASVWAALDADDQLDVLLPALGSLVKVDLR